MNFRVRGQFEIKILIVRHINTTYFIWIKKKKKLAPAIIWKLVTCQRITSKNARPRWVDTWSWTRDMVRWYGSEDTLFGKAVNWSQHWCAICVQNQFSCAPRLARKCEIEHWFPCGEDGRLEAVGVRSRVQSGMGRFAWLWGSAKNVYQKIRHEALLNNNNNLLHLI